MTINQVPGAWAEYVQSLDYLKMIAHYSAANHTVGHNSKDEDVRHGIFQALKVLDTPQPHHTFER